MVILDLLSNEYIKAMVIFVITFALAKIIYPLMIKYSRKLSAKTKTDLDEILLELMTRPVYYFILLIGFYIGLISLQIIKPYITLISGGFFGIALLLASIVLSKLSSILINRWLKVHKRYKKTPQVINKVVTIVIYVIALMMILNYFNIEISPLIATLGIGGLAVGLALQNTLSNFFAGLHLISDRPVNVGDFVELLDHNLAGFVEDVGWRSTKLVTLENNIVIIPNSKLAESTLVNTSIINPETNVHVECGVGYNSNLAKVEKVTLDVAKNIQKTIEGAVKDWEPLIRYHTFGDSNINFKVTLNVEDVIYKRLIIHEFIKALKERYDKEKIEISWPVRKIVKD